jgi:hypothetical protein
MGSEIKAAFGEHTRSLGKLESHGQLGIPLK